MRYAEFNKMWQDKFSALPVKFAFGDKQFEAMMASWGLTTADEDLKKVCGIIYGAYCLVKDVPLIEEHFEARSKAREEFLADEEQLKDALMEEFANYECAYTWSPKKAVDALFDEDEQEHNEVLKRVLPVAWEEYKAKHMDD